MELCLIIYLTILLVTINLMNTIGERKKNGKDKIKSQKKTTTYEGKRIAESNEN